MQNDATVTPVPSDLDHLVYAVPDLSLAVDEMEQRLGVRPTPGGVHEGRGSHNALVGLGGRCYLELIAPDPKQKGPRWFGLDEIDQPRFVGWAVRRADPEAWRAKAAHQLGEVESGSRQAPDGTVIRWKLTHPDAPSFGGVLPFLIDWLDTPHPGLALTADCSLLKMRASHPAPDLVERALEALELELPITMGPPRLRVTLGTPRGPIELGELGGPG